ncbi:MAG: ribose-phosphate diphosphokinase [Mycoplasmataceae bacterium]|nr:ribose-phosphate diphosphokinase [Mycoplasmataceae bacterium]
MKNISDLNNLNIKLFGMPNSQILAKSVSKISGIKLLEIKKTTFSDGEMILNSPETVRNANVFIICNTSSSESILELLLFVDSIKRASAGNITIINSYYGYSRQDRKAKQREPIGARLMANILETAGANKLITVDLHNPSIQGFFNIPVDDLRWSISLASYLQNDENMKFSIVSPDHGGAVRARILAELVSHSVKIAIVDKRRTGPNKSEILGILGKVSGKNIIIIDDIIDTGNTILKAAAALKKEGAKKIYIAATHGLFTKSFESFEKSDIIDKVLVSDSVENVYAINSKKLVIISLAPFISDVIKASIRSKSISQLYEKIKEKNDF